MVDYLGYLPHDKAVLEMNQSDMLLITNFPDASSKGIIPGKIFEYLTTGKRIISFGPKDADVEKILDETQTGRHFAYSDKEIVKSYIIEQYSLWKNNIGEKPSIGIEKFSRKNLTKKLVEILDDFL